MSPMHVNHGAPEYLIPNTYLFKNWTETRCWMWESNITGAVRRETQLLTPLDVSSVQDVK